MNWKQFANKNSDWLRVKQNNEEISFMDTRKIFEKDSWIFSISEKMFIMGDLRLVGPEKQYEIISFINQDPEEWFRGVENKYNIILARDYDIKCFYTAYRHEENRYSTADEVKHDELSHEDFIFTQGQINDLKSRLPENMAKIVDLAKVEVKDNGD